jgi:hypothetical protein
LKKSHYYMRNTELVITRGRSGVLLLGPSGSSIDHDTAHAALWSSLMQVLINPTSGDALQTVISELPKHDIDLIDKLVASEFILEHRDADQLTAIRNRAFFENRGFPPRSNRSGLRTFNCRLHGQCCYRFDGANITQPLLFKISKSS